MFTLVVRLTTDCEPGLVITCTTLPAGITALRDHCLPVELLIIVGVPGPVSVHVGYVGAVPLFVITVLPSTVPAPS